MKKHKALLGVAVLSCTIAGAAPGEPLGGEFRINADTAGFQGNPALAMKHTGEFVVAWDGDGPAGTGIWVQRHYSSGAVETPALRLDEPGTGIATDPALAMGRYGHFLVAWVGQTADHDVYARRVSTEWGWYEVGPQFQVNTTTAGDQGEPGAGPAVATNLYGSTYVVVWSASVPGGYGVFGRRIDWFGEALGDEFAISAVPSDTPPAVSVDMTDSGEFVVAWSGRTVGSISDDIVARRYDANGEALGPEFTVNTAAGTPHGSPVVAMVGSGTGFTVAWDAAGDIHARRYDAAGVALGAEFVVNTTTFGEQGRPRAATDHDGDLVVLWDSADGSDVGVHGQRFHADGTPAGTQFAVNQHVAGAQRLGDVGMDGDGDFIAAWASENQDGDGSGVYARRYRGPATVDLSVDLQDVEDPAQAGGSLVYDVLVTNHNVYPGFEGGGWATGVRVEVELSSGQTLESTGTAWRCSGTTRVSCEFDLGIWPEGAHSLRLYTIAPAAGTASATATVSADQDDGDPGNNTDVETTVLGDIEPDPLSFASLNDVEPSTVQVSNEVTVGGIDTPVPVRVSGGSYSLNGQPFTADDGVAANGDTLRLQHVSAGTWNRFRETIVSVGSGSASFRTTTRSADATPDAFAFTDQGGVARSAEVTSGTITVSGIEVPVAISVAGGSYSVSGAPFTTAAGTVSAGHTVRVRHTSSASFSSQVDTVLTIGGVSDTFSSMTLAADTTPDPFSFGSRYPVERNSLQTAGPAWVTGINAPAPISVTGGSYSLNGGPYTTAAGTVSEGETVRVQHVASDQFETTVETTLTIGGFSTVFATRTGPQDTVPNAFSFATQSGVARGSTVTSADVTIGGINDAAPVTVGGGAYSIDGGAFTTAAGSIQNGQRVRLQHTASTAFATEASTTLTIGGVSGTFTSVSEAEDTSPAPFSFADQTGVATGTTITSAPVTITGINAAAPVSVSGGSYSVNGGAFVTAGGTVRSGDEVRVQHVSSASHSSTVLTRLTVGGVSDTFSSTTGTTDTTPDPFDFADVSGARTGARIVSNTISVAGINTGVSLTVAGGDAEYSRNGGKYTSAPGTVFSGDTVTVRATAASTGSTAVDVVVTIGNRVDTWRVTTR